MTPLQPPPLPAKHPPCRSSSKPKCWWATAAVSASATARWCLPTARSSLQTEFQHQAADLEKIAFFKMMPPAFLLMVDQRVSTQQCGHVVMAVAADGNRHARLEPSLQANETGFRFSN